MIRDANEILYAIYDIRYCRYPSGFMKNYSSAEFIGLSQ